MRALAVAEIVSGIGTWITLLAVAAMVVFRGTGGVRETSALFLTGLAPLLVASPIAGFLADRYDRIRLMIASQLASAAVVALLIQVAGTHWSIYPLLAVLAALSSVMTPARQGALPDLVGRDRLTETNALMAQLVSVIRISAPLVAAAVLAVFSPRQAMLLDVLSYLIAVLLLLRLPRAPHRRAGPPAMRPVSAAQVADSAGEAAATPTALASASPATHAAPSGSAVRTLFGQPQLLLLFFTGYVGITVIMGFQVLSTVFTRDVLGGDEVIFGTLVGLLGLGMFGAATFLARSGAGRDPWADNRTGIMLMALLPLSVAIAEQIPHEGWGRVIVGSGALLGGVGNGLLSVQVPTLMQLLAPERVLGRVVGVFQAALVAGQLTAILTVPFVVPAHLSPGGYAALAAGLLGGLWVVVTVTLAILYRRRPLAGRPNSSGTDGSSAGSDGPGADSQELTAGTHVSGGGPTSAEASTTPFFD